MTTVSQRKILCPQCKKETLYSLDNPFRPFCCERCKLIDLGEWADEAFRVPVQESSEDSSWNQPIDEEE